LDEISIRKEAVRGRISATQRRWKDRGLAVVAASLLLLSSARSQTPSSTVYNFLRSDVGARAAAMAGSFVTATNDPDGLFYNVASLSTLDAPRGTAGFFKHLLDINSGYLSYSQKAEGIGSFGAGVLYTNYGSFTETDEAGNDLGTFSAGDLALLLGYSNQIEENLYYGAGIKVIYSTIAGEASTGAAVDGGILYLIPEDRIALGASVRNLGVQMSSYAGKRENLPLDLTIGGSVVPRGLPLLLCVNFHRLTDNVSSFGERLAAFTIGGEFTISKAVLLRFGYDNNSRKDLKIGESAGLAGFSAGLGILYQQFKLDYGLSSLGSIGALHRISIGSAF
jgi:hypothetical protein